VQVSVVINAWYGPFYDDIQKALGGGGEVTAGQLYGHLAVFCTIAFPYIAFIIGNRFFTAHFIFRWRTAMNDFYTARWKQVRHIEGASQRIQEDTMRFAAIMEGLGVAFVDSIMTLIAFLPVLAALSIHVETLPIIGAIPYPLVTLSIVWSIFGTVLLLVAGIKLPGLEFKNQIKNGKSLDDLLPEAFALVREAAKRTRNERHFNVQLIGGVALHEGKIAEMRTGEGKTLTITLAAYLNALSGKGVHIVTVNDYLAKRDSLEMGQIYNFLGLLTSGTL